MHTELTLYHAEHSSAVAPENWGLSAGSTWKTCLRQIGFQLSAHGEVGKTLPGIKVLQGSKAYAFCLEVICGLHSPLLGETEVLGQFKDFVADYKINGESQSLKKIFDQLIEDAKKVRQKYLTNLGSQSYGSLIRRYLKEDQSLQILGAGRLVRDIVPWLKSKESIQLFCRTPQKASAWTSHFKNVTLSSLKGVNGSSSPLVIAAPMKSSDILRWMDSASITPALIIDLREDCETDLLPMKNVRILKLTELFQEIKGVQSQLTQTVEQAQKQIQEISSVRSQAAAVRPFGWDDLCA